MQEKKQDRRQIKNTDNIKTEHDPEKSKQCKTMQNTAKQNYPGLVAFYDTRPANNAPESIQSSSMGAEPE